MKFNRAEAVSIKFLALFQVVPCLPSSTADEEIEALPNTKARLVQVLCLSEPLQFSDYRGCQGVQALHVLSQESLFQEFTLPCLASSA